MNPWSSSQKSLNSFDRYLFPVSQANVTTRFSSVCSRQYLSAAQSNVPLDEPARMPSLRNSSLAARKDSASEMLYALSAALKSAISGMKSSPMPSTSHELL